MTVQDQETSLVRLAEHFLGVLEGDPDQALVAASRLLAERLRTPQSYVTVVGETSSGKSTLINALLGRALLPMAAAPTSAVVVHVACEDRDDDRFVAHFRDARQAELDATTFRTWCQSPTDSLLRLQVRTAPRDRRRCGLNIFDTPGYNALAVEHEDLLREFLPESDAVVFVVGYRTGFGEADRELLLVVRDARSGIPDLPLLLVINRVPEGCSTADARVREISDRVAAVLGGRPALFLVASVRRDGADPPVPDAESVWHGVAAIVTAPGHRRAVTARLAALLADLAAEADELLEARALALEAGPENLEAVEAWIRSLTAARDHALACVARAMNRLAHRVSQEVARRTAEIREQVSRDIATADRWFGADVCAAWLGQHRLPGATRRAERGIRDLIVADMEALDRELAEIANTAVRDVSREARLRSAPSAEMAKLLVVRMSRRMVGSVASSLLRGVGGVGGVAAGTGNVVKMAVKRVGGLFNMTFRRPVYDAIGRTFTKRFVARLNVALSVLVEAGLFLHHVKTWQNELERQAMENIDAWEAEIQRAARDEEIPRLWRQNDEDVRRLYDEEIADARARGDARNAAEWDEARRGVAARREALAGLRAELERVKEDSP